ncbi:MAG: phosphoglycerate kinase [Saprospiraceae bacterium]|jgi:phosphoglycerate kinase|nr:phosphoglycerate kinase [Saprospiraceae bacterium]
MQFLNLVGKRIIVRVDFNVPLDSNLNVTDDTRIKESIPTLKYLLNLDGVSLVLLSHLDRPLKKLLPDGTIDVNRFSLKNILPNLTDLLGCEVLFADDCIGEPAETLAKSLKPGQVLLLENTRFHKEEEKGDETFSKKLAGLGEAYINDAFGTAHRAHASTCIIANYFPKNLKAFGFLMKKELASAKRLLVNPDKPFTAIIGGAKVSDKILLLEKMIDSVDNMIIGGGMAYTFFKALGGQVGKSLVEEDRIENAGEILKKAKGKIKLLLPEDSIAANAFTNEAQTMNVDNMFIPDDMMGLDIGPKAIASFTETIASSRSILWNGPMGVFEMPNFSKGTFEIAKAVVAATERGAFSLIGGGDSAAAIHQMHFEDKVSFVSTGGGAMLELLEGKELPGVKSILEG